MLAKLNSIINSSIIQYGWYNINFARPSSAFMKCSLHI